MMDSRHCSAVVRVDSSVLKWLISFTESWRSPRCVHAGRGGVGRYADFWGREVVRCGFRVFIAMVSVGAVVRATPGSGVSCPRRG